MDDNNLQMLHTVELEILKEVDSFCKKNKIPYSLYCGTMLGAVRHKGFIPWDDDIDICMLRKDYNRFVRLWIKSNNNDYIIQNKFTDPTYKQSFTKIRKNGTLFIQLGEEEEVYNRGIFIDILPLDRYPNNKIQKIIFKWDLMNYLLYTKDHIPYDDGILKKNISKLLLYLNKNKKSVVRKKYLKRITKYNKDDSLKLISANSMDGLNHLMPASLPDTYIDIPFEDCSFRCYSDYEGLLSAWYGNYMTLPPESERVWRHRPVEIVF